MMKLHEDHKKLIIVVFFGIISFSIIGMGTLIQNRKNIANSEATSGCFCNDQDKCYPDGCTRKPIKSDGSIDYGRCGQVGGNAPYGQAYDTNSVEANRYFCIQQPPCCAEMFRRNDPEACCWPEKGYCYETYCTAETTANNNCGWYWKFHDNATPNGYGCMKGESPSTMQPVFGLPAIASSGNTPTSTPKPRETATPQPQPTSTPAPTSPSQPTSTVPPNQPTSTPAPTNSPIPTNQQPTSAANTEPSYNPQPTNPPLPTNTPYQFPTIEIKSPKELAREVINPQNIQKLNRSTEKVLNTPKEGLNTIKQADQKLERTANAWIERVRIFIENLMN